MGVKISKFSKLFLIICLAFSFSFSAKAQTAPEPSLGIKLTPETPGPFENVQITLSSYSTDLSRALITWDTNGKTELSGYGKTVFSTTSPAVGSQKNISITIITETGQTLQRYIVIAPQDVDLLWEAIDSYTPPFYKGRSLPSKESLIKVVAIPSFRNGAGVKTSPDDLVYNWSQNYNPIQNLSGYGKSSFLYKNAFLDSSDYISLTVSSRDGSQVAKKDLRLSVGTPKIVFYPKNTLTSFVSKYSFPSKYKLTTDSVGVVAVPYFFSTSKNTAMDEDLNYSWKINNKTQSTPEKKDELVLRKPTETQGVSNVSLSIKKGGAIYQSSQTSFSVEY